jgi:dihydropteroate synthase
MTADPSERLLPRAPATGVGTSGPFGDPGSGSDPTPERTARAHGGAIGPTVIGRDRFAWGERTFVMGIVNVTPDSFSGDGLLASRESGGAGTGQGAVGLAAVGQAAVGQAAVGRAAVIQARQMVEEGADILDIGGESTRPGHDAVEAAEELARVVPVIRAVRAALPSIPISVDTVKPTVARAAIEAGADLVNDIWGVAEDDRLARVAAELEVPLVVMHNRAEPRYGDLVAEVIADLERALERSLAAGVPWARLIVDPGFGFGKTPAHNLRLLRELDRLGSLGRPVLLGTSRKSTLGRVLDLPPDQRVEATLATTALGIAAGVDMVRVHDVRANVRVARMADAIVRGASPLEVEDG